TSIQLVIVTCNSRDETDQASPLGHRYGPGWSRGQAPRDQPPSQPPYWTFTETVFGLISGDFGRWTLSTPSLKSADSLPASTSLGNAKRRTNLPYSRSILWNFLPFSSFSSLRSPSTVSIPSSNSTFTSSFFTSGRSALTMYSLSVSWMSTGGAHSPNDSVSVSNPLRGRSPSIRLKRAWMPSSSRNGSHRTKFI